MCPILKGWGSKRDGAEWGREQNAYAEELTQPQRLLQQADAEEELPHRHLGTLVKIDADGAHVSDSPLKYEIKIDPIVLSLLLNAHVPGLRMNDTCEKQASLFFLNFHHNIITCSLSEMTLLFGRCHKALLFPIPSLPTRPTCRVQI